MSRSSRNRWVQVLMAGSSLLVLLGTFALVVWWFVLRTTTATTSSFQVEPFDGNGDTLLQWVVSPDKSRKPSSWVFNASDYRLLPVSREPSAAVALPEHKGFLVLDDEVSDSPSRGILFYRMVKQRLVSVPVHLPVISSKWDDWEAATASRDVVYLLTSHSKNRHKRCQLCRIPRAQITSSSSQLKIPSSMVCHGGKAQRQQIIDALRQAANRHGFSLPPNFASLAPKEGGLDLEGMVWERQSKALLLGLRGPLASRGGREYAILLKARWESSGWKFGFRSLLALGGRGIRGLTSLPSGRILVSAGPVGNRGAFDLYSFASKPGIPLFPVVSRVTSSSFPALQPGRPFKPEALVWWKKRLFVFSDNGEWGGSPAHFLVLPKNLSH